VIFSLDATEDNGSLGRLVNHGSEKKTKANIVPQVVISSRGPHIVFVALVDLIPGIQLLYDYNDKSSGLNWLQQ
jgi:hypothetical protein